MPEQWIDERLPGQAASPEFVSRLRTELIEVWRDDDDTLHIKVGAPPKRRPRRVLPWIVGIAATAAAAIPVAIALRSDTGTRVDIVPITASATVESTAPPTTTPLTGPALLAELSAHRWVGQRPGGMPAGSSAFWIEFDPKDPPKAPDPRITLFDGCGGGSGTRIMLVDSVLKLLDVVGPLPLDCGGGDASMALTSSSLEISQSDGVHFLNVIPTDPTVQGFFLTALDTLAPATTSDAVGYWKLPRGGILDLTADGDVGVGYCERLGHWSLDGGQLSISGLDPTLSAACAGVADSSSVTQLERQPYTARFGGNLVLDHGDTVIVLNRSSANLSTDMVDVVGTIFGFGLSTPAPADFVVGVVSGERGQPTFDSGWYTAAVESCGAGRTARAVQWGDLVLGFTRVGTQDRLWSWSIGDDAEALAERFGVPGGIPTSTPSGLGLKPPNRIAVATTIEEIRSWHANVYDTAFAFAEITLTDADGKPVANDDDAVRGVLSIGGQHIDVRLDHGTITWMSMKDGTSC